MKLLRNPEIRTELFIHLLLTLFFLAASLLFPIPAFLLILLSASAYLSVHMLFLKKRYCALDTLNHCIDRILHGQDELLITTNSEGELSILKSEIHKMTLRLKESTDALQSEKLQLIDAIADISHQLRTPLTAMNLSVSMLASEDLPIRRRIEISHDLRKSLKRIDWLIDALLKTSRLNAGVVQFQKESVLVRELFEKAAAPLLIVMDLKDQTLQTDIRSEQLCGDIAWCTEALGNVLKNCVEHTPIGGCIHISAQETPLFTEIIIRDNGAGFDENDLPHLYDRFYKGRSASAESIGIGLALARSVISQHNGTICASNRPTGGAQFTIRFYKQVV